MNLTHRRRLLIFGSFEFTAAVVPETSPGAADASITISASGGKPPYTYSLDNVTYQSSNVFAGLTAGTYTVYVKDSFNTVIHQTIVIGFLPQFVWGTSYGHLWGTSYGRKWGGA